jgi:hypothetical protein
MEKAAPAPAAGAQSSGVWMTESKEAFPLRCPFCEGIVEGPARGSRRVRHLVTCHSGSHALQRVTVLTQKSRRA